MAHLENFDLNLLKSLLVLLEERNVTRAGERLHLSQSAVSAVLARLRRDLNDPLLVRSGRSLLLTPYAEAMQGPLVELLSMAGRLVEAKERFDPGSEDRTFRLMASDYVALVEFPKFTAYLRQHAANVRLELQSLEEGYIEKLRRQEIDVLFISDLIRRKEVADFPHKRVFVDRFVACVSADNSVVRDHLDAWTLGHMAYIEYAPHGMRSIADVRMDEQGIHRDVVVRTDHQLLVPSLIEGSSTVAIVPERLARLVAGHTRIKIVEAAFDLPAIDQIAVWHPSRTEDPAILWLVHGLLAHSASATPAGAGNVSPSS